MKAITVLAALSVIAAAFGAAAVEAATWHFQYRSDIGRFSGTIEGELQGDGNTVLVTAVPDFVKFKGVPLASFPVLTTGSTIYGVDRAPSVTLDGSLLDFLACSVEFCATEGFGFDPDTIEFTPSLITSIPVDGFEFGYREAADPAKWSLSAVPDPAVWMSMLIGFAAVGSAARRNASPNAAA
ncbi:MAG: hypothetical protein H7268_04100 [Sandarakinorhabdus sp.]|nr:hypothetical protein [Sandarakinorhabdus sp.]